MAVVSLIAACSAAKLRTLPASLALEVVAHWALVAVIALGVFYYRAWLRCRHAEMAGPLLLRVRRIAIKGRKRLSVSLLLTGFVIVDGVFMSVIALPTGAFLKMLTTWPPYGFVLIMFGQGVLWSYCWEHWTADVYWVEFRQNGLRLFANYCPWRAMTRIGWSPAHPNRLVILYRGFFTELAIEPDAKNAVTDLLARLRPPSA